MWRYPHDGLHTTGGAAAARDRHLKITNGTNHIHIRSADGSRLVGVIDRTKTARSGPDPYGNIMRLIRREPEPVRPAPRRNSSKASPGVDTQTTRPHSPATLQCKQCGRDGFVKALDLARHVKNEHGQKSAQCPKCGQTFKHLGRHVSACDGTGSKRSRVAAPAPVTGEDLERAFAGVTPLPRGPQLSVTDELQLITGTIAKLSQALATLSLEGRRLLARYVEERLDEIVR